MMLNKAEQLKIHLWGLFHQGVAADDIKAMFDYMQAQHYPVQKAQALTSLKDAVEEYQQISGEPLPIKSQQFLIDNMRIKALIDLTAHLVVGDNAKTEACIQQILNNRPLTKLEMEHVMQHAAIYSGFPVEMNGRAVLMMVNNQKEK